MTGAAGSARGRAGAWLLAAALALLPVGPAAAGLLAEEEAFPFSVERIDDTQLVARWDTAEDYYLYRHRLEFSLKDEGNAIAGVTLPPATQHEDEFFGEVEIYYGTLQVHIDTEQPLGDHARLQADFQGCNEPRGVCYPPMSAEAPVGGAATTVTTGDTAPDGAVAGGSGTGGGPGAGGGAAGGFGGGDSQLAGLLQGGSLAALLGGFFIAGLLLAFTACLYPMIPILSGLIVGAGGPAGHASGRPGTGRAFWLSFVYVQAVAVTYAAAGAAAGLSGRAIQADLQGPWVAGAFALLFVALAAGMFGFYNFRLPAALETRLQHTAHRLPGGRTAGVAGMGVLSTLIVGACSGPALVAALAFISNTGDAGLGALALYVMALGMGAPLLVIGTAAGRWLPRSGPWMVAVKQLFGFVFLGVALWMIARFVPNPVELAAWGVLLLAGAVWLAHQSLRGAGNGPVIRASDRPLRGPRWAGVGAAVLVGLLGSAQIGGAATGAADPLRPWSGIAGPSPAQARAEVLREWTTFRSVDELQGALEEARAEGRPAVVDVSAEWCVYCVQLEERTFPDDEVREVLDDVVRLRADVTAMSAEHREMLQDLGVFLPPAVLFYGRDGEEREAYRIAGFMEAGEFADHARAALEPDGTE